MDVVYGITPASRRSRRSRSRSGSVELKIFLPYGVMFPLAASNTMNLSELKDKIWRFAKNFPLASELLEPADYVLSCVTSIGEDEELMDERMQLCDVDFFMPIISVKAQEGNHEERLMRKHLQIAAGVSSSGGNSSGQKDSRQNASGEKYLQEVALEEISDFKRNVLRDVCEPTVRKRCESWNSRAMYQYAPQLEPSANVPESILKLLTGPKQTFIVNVMHVARDSSVSIKSIAAELLFTVNDLLRVNWSKVEKLKAHGKQDESEFDTEAFVLKITGREELLLGNYPLVQYKYIRECMTQGDRPDLVMVPRSEVRLYDDLDRIVVPNLPPPVPERAYLDDGVAEENLSLWSIDNPLNFKMVRVECLNLPADTNVRLHAGIYHGSETLCAIQRSQPKQTIKQVVSWNEQVYFSELSIKDIPRSARLAVVIYSIRGNKRKKHNRESKIGLHWANLPLFDYRRRLRTGTVMLRCWPCEGALNEELHPIGSTTPNPSDTCATVELEFPKYGQAVVFPLLPEVLQKASACPKSGDGSGRTQNKALKDELALIFTRDRLYQLEEQNKEVLWKFRLNCRDHPKSLPKLLQSVKWSSCDDVAIMQAMLQSWPTLEPEDALELLDYSYTDENVRDFSVKCLESFTDEQFLTYLPQLVQVLKYEAYLDCALGRFLVRRSLTSRRLANFLFWYMRAEMHTPEATRYGLLLEAYCRSSVSHMGELIKQITLMEHFHSVCTTLEGDKYDGKKTEDLPAAELLFADGKAEICQNCLSPLHPTIRLGSLLREKVKVFNSKKRPIRMQFQSVKEHASMGSPSTGIIFKIGDDLRQDLLTLQLLRIMERLWRQEGHELKMNPYGCLPMGYNVGMIELVQNSTTISAIQKSMGGHTAVFNDSMMWQWLVANNEQADLDKVVENFTLSCAAYCVATFVLGIGDRHNANIMLTQDGRLFHIDFGHFLGNFKTKMKVRREFTPFILDTGFLYIIAGGGKEKKGELERKKKYSMFLQLMEKLYVILHRNGNLFVNLFAMMLSTGIPELRCLEDIHYFRDMLALNKSEEDCKKFWNSQVSRVLDVKYQFLSRMNWLVHNIAK